MSLRYVDEQTFEGISFAESEFHIEQYHNCWFRHCDFSGVDVATSIFEDCHFDQCNLTRMLVMETSFRNTCFSGCKALGVDWGSAREIFLEFHFHDCQLDLGSFFNCKLTVSTFKDCSLREVDFAGANLSGRSLDGCNLEGAIFEGTNLSGADLRLATNYFIDPEKNEIEGASVSWPEATGLLHKYGLKWT